MKVFFVKYNDPIYVKLEKLDIMIRLASQANIAQVSRGRWRGAWALVLDGITTNELWSLGRLPNFTMNSSFHSECIGQGSVSKHSTNVI